MDLQIITPGSINQAAEKATLKAASVLAEIIGLSVEMELDRVQILSEEQLAIFLKSVAGQSGSIVDMDFTGGISGSAYFILTENTAQAVLDLLEIFDPGLVKDAGGKTAVLLEIGNVVLNMYSGTIVEQIGHSIVYQPPRLRAYADQEGIYAYVRKDSQVDLWYPILTSRISISGFEFIIYFLLVFNG